MQRNKVILFFSVLNLQTVWVFFSSIICQWSKHSGIFWPSETNDFLAPPGALIAIPTYYWVYKLSVLLLGSTHFFAKYGAFSPEIKMSNNLLNGCEYWSIDFCNEIELIGKQSKTMRNKMCREISFYIIKWVAVFTFYYRLLIHGSVVSLWSNRLMWPQPSITDQQNITWLATYSNLSITW